MACSGTHGVELTGSDSSIKDSDVYDVGCDGVAVSGGDPVKLTPSNLFIHNNTIHRFARVSRTIRVGVAWSGCGTTSFYLCHACSLTRDDGIEPLVRMHTSHVADRREQAALIPHISQVSFAGTLTFCAKYDATPPKALPCLQTKFLMHRILAS